MKDNFDDEDLHAMELDRRFLVAVDAYRTGCCSLAQMGQLAFATPPYIPRDLTPLAYKNLVFKIADRIEKGSILIKEHEKNTFSSFYRTQITE